MQDILKLLTPTQWIVLGVGVVMLIAGSKDYVVSIYNSFFKDKTETDETEEDVKNNTLTSIVAKWEVLSNACKDANLMDAYNKLQEVFPMLVSVYTPKINRKTNDEK